jgi:hypothetical protein
MRIPVVGDRVNFNVYNGESKPGTCSFVHEDDNNSIDIEIDDPEDVSKNHIQLGTDPGTYSWPEINEASIADNTTPNNPPPPRP